MRITWVSFPTRSKALLLTKRLAVIVRLLANGWLLLSEVMSIAPPAHPERLPCSVQPSRIVLAPLASASAPPPPAEVYGVPLAVRWLQPFVAALPSNRQCRNSALPPVAM